MVLEIYGCDKRFFIMRISSRGTCAALDLVQLLLLNCAGEGGDQTKFIQVGGVNVIQYILLLLLLLL